MSSDLKTKKVKVDTFELNEAQMLAIIHHAENDIKSGRGKMMNPRESLDEFLDRVENKIKT